MSPLDPLRARIAAAYRADEAACVREMVAEARMAPDAKDRIAERTQDLVEAVRGAAARHGGLDAFLHEYGLANAEGVALMCLAEALLRIPDADTADRLIRDKIAPADWHRHLGHSPSLFVNASTWGLMLTGRVIHLDRETVGDAGAFLGRLVARSGEPVIRQAMLRAMRIIGGQFVIGRTIEEALEAAGAAEARGYAHSFDMLGEAALTARDADRYFEAYTHAIDAIGAAAESGDPARRPGISVKLSALHPRYVFAQREAVLATLPERLGSLAAAAAKAGIALTVDAEEADRLDLSLDLFEIVHADAGDGWDGLGLAVQAYQKRAPAVIDWIVAQAGRHGRRIPVRLVKGAYWDTEIKRAQERGLDGYPVYTRKASTDIAYIACAKRMLAAGEAIYPQFATHNAQTVASVLEIAGERPFEFQRLYGMGEALYDHVLATEQRPVACRVYAPVGSHDALLPYLVRRLLENGANPSFVNRIVDDDAPMERMIADPVDLVGPLAEKPNPGIPLPRDLFGDRRRNSRGLDLSDRTVLEPLAAEMEAVTGPWTAAAIVAGEAQPGMPRLVHDPADNRREVGTVFEADETALDAALAAATDAAPAWDATPAETRAACLERAADLLEVEAAEAMALCVREAGKTIPNALAEVREAADFCRYYAAEAHARFAAPDLLPGPTGESNRLTLHGRGVFACISPWNFPLAIFTGQVAAALAAGNAAVAKPAEQTPLIAAFAVRLLHEAGVPAAALNLVPGSGEAVGAPLVADPRVAGVAFTGSVATGRAIARALAARDGPIVPLIAETGGMNAMIVDSSALPEQVVADVLASAFDSAGQRCSCLRVLFLQADIADRVLAMLAGAMAELRIGDPGLLATDVGPVIDAEAKATLDAHIARMEREARIIHRCPLPPEAEHGTFVAPTAVEVDSIERVGGEVFGPILHVVRYERDRLEQVVDAINATGYGLTLGIHSRIDDTARRVIARARVGNVYVNRNMVGSVVGVQPFGGEGLSGTGPKTGGPNTLLRYAVERTVTVNTAAIGGNAALLSQSDESG
ncbi:MAG: bifunctional proline dehydrogenase/L-glutamate gamma-semialdehyde dehydrogenase [Rhodospirillaceae bacterium]|nr:bifunctional proline dehydrogenase/L-glutamate gamma-semialdehyde dehydrogenase [Rhodospirillaceae bacterium]